MKNVSIIGGGVLGSQVAFQSAFFDCNVVMYARTEDSVKRIQEKLAKLVPIYGAYFNNPEKAQAAHDAIKISMDMSEVLADSDVMIESIAENLEAKQKLYESIQGIAPEKTIFLTNSSTMMPSAFCDFTDRPDRFLALHFANSIWQNNIAEVMSHDTTDPKYNQIVMDFAKQINMVPILVKKEQPGYILNSLLVPLLQSAEMLLANGVGDVETIDRTWMIATGAPVGPFAMLDVIGLTTAYNISLQASLKNPHLQGVTDMLKAYIDAGKLGVATGEGFYKYPNPSYKASDFLKG
ncbi:3-hydroxyacyl-CoA dehydrogenase [Macrococcus epidermidis]|uniref:6-phosphogluconate dehydrogenase, decarboxylating n=1 Tax=Macrococcus epidermidis TaxID=1902580 RepID=A0A327ZQP1_9STAP|nr:3-hydroxyacyl-CoA dehydrogenase [Macrococcus epidermidis]RAK43864.1 3-hydroxyacyl-CoA dehydrogenase [Macrococcus epidermidis]